MAYKHSWHDGNVKWTNIKGDKIHLKDMNDEYIKNCLNRFKYSKKPSIIKWIKIFNDELHYRRFEKIKKIIKKINNT